MEFQHYMEKNQKNLRLRRLAQVAFDRGLRAGVRATAAPSTFVTTQLGGF